MKTEHRSYEFGNEMNLEAVAFPHCGHCIKSKPDNVSPQEYARYELAICKNHSKDDEFVIAVKCLRHDHMIMVLPIDVDAIPGVRERMEASYCALCEEEKEEEEDSKTH